MRTPLYGKTDLENPRLSEDIQVVPYDFEDLDANHKFFVPIPEGHIVTHVGHVVTTAFAGGTPAVVVGDGTTANLFMTTGLVTPGTAGNVALGVGAKMYSAAGVVCITHAAGLTAGAGKLLIYTLDLRGNWRVPDL